MVSSSLEHAEIADPSPLWGEAGDVPPTAALVQAAPRIVVYQPGEPGAIQHVPPPATGYRPTVDGMIAAWLASKGGLSGSGKTLAAYSAELDGYRAALRAIGLDLDGDPALLAPLAQAYAARAGKRGRPGASSGPGHQPPTASSYNQRLACLSSWYAYCQRMGWLTANPLDRVERRKVQAYAAAVPLAAATVKERLAAIDRGTLAGQRDYALLAVALATGRRLSELAALSWGDLELQGDRLHVTWPHTKGGKVMRDLLEKRTATAVMTWLYSFYGSDLGDLPATAPVWVGLASNRRGNRLTKAAIADVCEQRIGTSKVHALRHTFSHSMRQTGAGVEDVQRRLGHASLATTSRYLAGLAAADNPHANALADLFGL